MSHEEALNFIKQNGPSMPAEVGRAIQKDSILTKILLQELTEKKVLNQSKRRIGNSRLFYLPYQEDKMRSRMLQDLKIQEKKVLEAIQKKGYVFEKELSPHAKFFIRELADFLIAEEKDGEKVWKYHKYLGGIKPETQENINDQKEPEELRETKTQEDKNNNENKKSLKEYIKKDLEVNEKENIESDFLQDCLRKIKEYGRIDEFNTLKKAKEFESVLTIESRFGREKLYVVMKSKNKITDKDLKKAYDAGIKKHMQVLFLTNGEITGTTSKNFEKKYGSLMKIIRV